MSIDSSVWNSVQNDEYDWAEPEAAEAIDDESPSSSSSSLFLQSQITDAVEPLAPQPTSASATLPQLFNDCFLSSNL